MYAILASSVELTSGTGSFCLPQLTSLFSKFPLSLAGGPAQGPREICRIYPVPPPYSCPSGSSALTFGYPVLASFSSSLPLQTTRLSE